MTSSVFRYLNLLAIAAATNWIWTSLASSFNPQETLTSAICGTSQMADANNPYVISSNQSIAMDLGIERIVAKEYWRLQIR